MTATAARIERRGVQPIYGIIPTLNKEATHMDPTDRKALGDIFEPRRSVDDPKATNK